MKKYFYTVSIVLAAVFCATGFAHAITCPSGSHTFSGGTQASGYDMCIPDVGSGEQVHGSPSSNQSSNKFTPSTKGTITPSGTTAQTSTQGVAIDTQVNSEVNRLSGTSIYAQAKALYDQSVAVNRSDYNSVVQQTKNTDYETSDVLRRAYNVRAIGRLNQVWTGIMALEATYVPPQENTPSVTTPPVTVPSTPPDYTSSLPSETTTPPSNVVPPGSSPSNQYSASDLVPGQTYSTPSDQPSKIVTPDQNVDISPGSSVKYVDKNIWQTIQGVVHFLEKTAIDGRYKVRSHAGDSFSIRGTEFVVKEETNKTTLTLISGAIDVTTANGKSKTSLKAGNQIEISNNKISKPKKFDVKKLDKWYEKVPVGSNLANVSWKKTNDITTWSRECTVTAGTATPTEALTADEAQYVESFNQSTKVFKNHEINTVVANAKIFASKDKKVANVDTKYIRAMTDGKALYYSGDAKGVVWKFFKDKGLVSGLLSVAIKENIPSEADKNSFVFDHWEKNGTSRVAVYSMKYTQAGTETFINNGLASGAGAGQNIATGTVSIDEATQLWVKSTTVANVKTGKILLPLLSTCKYTYGSGVKITTPKAKSMTATAGLDEFKKFYQDAQ